MSGNKTPPDSWNRLPKRIFLVRHGESEGNVDHSVFCRIADSKIPLTTKGFEQAEACGNKIREIIESSGNNEWKVYFYVSPYVRTLQTLQGVGRAFEPHHIVGVREEPRIREQDFGNFQDHAKMKQFKNFREKFGKFFYRFPEGESAADVYDRVTGFLESLWRDVDMGRLQRYGSTSLHELNVVLVTHGVTMRVFLTRWFKWTTQQFESLSNPENCEIRIMELGSGGDYSLAINHSYEQLRQWGLSSFMCREQEWRKESIRGSWSEEWANRHECFFDHFPKADKSKLSHGREDEEENNGNYGNDEEESNGCGCELEEDLNGESETTMPPI